MMKSEEMLKWRRLLLIFDKSQTKKGLVHDGVLGISILLKHNRMNVVKNNFLRAKLFLA